MIKSLLAVSLLLVFAMGVSRANLGDTEEQCLAKYGSESDPQDNLGSDVIGDKAASFNVKTPQGAFLVNIIFFHGIASHEAYSNADDSRGLSEDQMKAILNSESAGLKWNKRKSVYRTDRSGLTSGSEDWLRSDGATAKFWVSGKADTGEVSGEVELSTKEYAVDQRFLDKKDGAN